MSSCLRFHQGMTLQAFGTEEAAAPPGFGNGDHRWGRTNDAWFGQIDWLKQGLPVDCPELVGFL